MEVRNRNIREINFKKKLVLGTMKLNNYFNNSNELSKFLTYAHQNGIKQLHVSREYDFNEIMGLLEAGWTKKDYEAAKGTEEKSFE